MKENMKKILLLSTFVVASLAGCDRANTPQIFGSEVPEGALNAPRLVAVPSSSPKTSWPRLGDVPSKPTDFSPPAAIGAASAKLQDDRAEGEELRARVEQETEGMTPLQNAAEIPAEAPASTPALVPPQLPHTHH